jgi:hypothetical protein
VAFRANDNQPPRLAGGGLIVAVTGETTIDRAIRTQGWVFKVHRNHCDGFADERAVTRGPHVQRATPQR